MSLHRLRAAVLAAVVLVTGVAATASAQSRNEGQRVTLDSTRPAAEFPEFVPGEVLVGYEKGVAGMARANVRAEVGLQKVRDLRVPSIELLKTAKGTTVREAIAELERDPRVSFAEPNYYVHSSVTTPNDPEFGKLWGLNNTGQTVNGDPGTADKDIDAPEGWDQETGDPNIVVAVADTGVTFDHPDLAGNAWTNAGETPGNGLDDDGNGVVDDVNGADFIDNDGDPTDFQLHGTHVAGTIGAVGNDGFGITGVAWDTSIMGVRVLNSSGSGTYAQIADGFDYAGDEGADVVNASLGGGGTDTDAAPIKAAIDSHPDTLYVVAAGNETNDNDGGSARFPCNISSPNLLCVAATDNDDGLASFSNYGTTSVDMGAPGVNIFSTFPSWEVVQGPFGFEGSGSGSFEGWTTGGTTPSTWAPTSEAASMGSFALSDSPTADYPADSNTWVMSPQLDLSGEKGCQALYDLNLATEFGFDFLNVEISGDGASWTVMDSWTGSTTGDFFSLTTPVDQLDGDSSAWMRFRLISDDIIELDGAYLDHVRIQCLNTPDASDYAFLNGTSMASPHVAGAAAVLFSAAPSATVAEVKDALMNTGDPLGSLSGMTVSGRRLNLKNALDAMPTNGVVPSLTIDDASQIEGDSGSTDMVFDVSLSEAAGDTVTVDFATADGTAIAGTDYTTTSGTLTFNAGQVDKTISVPVLGDTVDEANETFFVNLSAPTNATVADAQGVGTIQDDDGTSSVDAPTLLKPKAKYTKKKTVALKWSHSSLPGGASALGTGTTFDVRARRAAYKGGFKPAQVVKTGVTGDGTKFKGKPGSTYCFSVAATDGATTSEFSNEKCTSIPVDDRAMSSSRGWNKKTGKGYFLNTYTMTKKKGKSLSLGTVNGKEISLVVEKCKGCGTVKVFFKGKQVAKIGLGAPKTKKKVIVQVAKFNKSKKGPLEVKTISKNKRVAIDGVGVRA